MWPGYRGHWSEYHTIWGRVTQGDFVARPTTGIIEWKFVWGETRLEIIYLTILHHTLGVFYYHDLFYFLEMGVSSSPWTSFTISSPYELPAEENSWKLPSTDYLESGDEAPSRVKWRIVFLGYSILETFAIRVDGLSLCLSVTFGI